MLPIESDDGMDKIIVICEASILGQRNGNIVSSLRID